MRRTGPASVAGPVSATCGSRAKRWVDVRRGRPAHRTLRSRPIPPDRSKGSGCLHIGCYQPPIARSRYSRGPCPIASGCLRNCAARTWSAFNTSTTGSEWPTRPSARITRRRRLTSSPDRTHRVPSLSIHATTRSCIIRVRYETHSVPREAQHRRGPSVVPFRVRLGERARRGLSVPPAHRVAQWPHVLFDVANRGVKNETRCVPRPIVMRHDILPHARATRTPPGDVTRSPHPPAIRRRRGRSVLRVASFGFLGRPRAASLLRPPP